MLLSTKESGVKNKNLLASFLWNIFDPHREWKTQKVEEVSKNIKGLWLAGG